MSLKQVFSSHRASLCYHYCVTSVSRLECLKTRTAMIYITSLHQVTTFTNYFCHRQKLIQFSIHSL